MLLLCAGKHSCGAWIGGSGGRLRSGCGGRGLSGSGDVLSIGLLDVTPLAPRFAKTYGKCFDRVPVHIVLQLAIEQGMSRRLVLPLQTLYQSLAKVSSWQRHWQALLFHQWYHTRL